MNIRNTTVNDLPILNSIFGKEYIDSHINEISIEKSIIYFNAENKIDVVILLKKSSLFDYFDGVIPNDDLDIDNIVKDYASLYEYNHYEIINWYVTNDDYRLLNNIFQQTYSLNHFVLLWTQCKEYESFPIQGFYNFNDKVLVDIPND